MEIQELSPYVYRENSDGAFRIVVKPYRHEKPGFSDIFKCDIYIEVASGENLVDYNWEVLEDVNGWFRNIVERYLIDESSEIRSSVLSELIENHPYWGIEDDMIELKFPQFIDEEITC